MILGVFFAAFWVCPKADPLLARVCANVTWIALGALYALGLTPGFALGTAFGLLRRREPSRGP
jgi:hypothetical protein